MPPRSAAALVVVACWDAWRLLLARAGDLEAAAILAALTAVLAHRAWQVGAEPVRPWPVVAALAASAVASWTGPALLQIGAAVAALVLSLYPHGRWPVLALALLALPVLPTLDFLLAYPLRHVSALVTAAMLRLNGMAVGVEGVALVWGERRLLFDGPCSGVRMLWAALLLASLVAAARRLDPGRFALLLVVAALLALSGNALRAAGLFYLEAGMVSWANGPALHEAVGLAAFLLVAAAALAPLRFVPRRNPA